MDVVIQVDLFGDETDGEIVWQMEDGADVNLGDPIAEIEMAKAVVVIDAPAAGRLSILVASGSVVEPGAVIGRIA